MLVEVGNVITFRNKKWTVFEIQKFERQVIATENWVEVKNKTAQGANATVVGDTVFEEFDVGDVVVHTGTIVQLVVPGEDIFFIYKDIQWRKHARKHIGEGLSGSTEGPTTRASGGDQGESGTGGQSDGEAPTPENPPGRSGEGGDTVRA